MPSSISVVHCVGVPSSSTLSEPRRAASVPSSTIVTPLAATCCPMRPLNAEVPLRLKSPSRPWPTASCSSTPGQPAPSTTVIVPAGAGTASRLTCAVRTASFTSARQRPDSRNSVYAKPAAAAGVALLAAAVLLDDDS